MATTTAITPTWAELVEQVLKLSPSDRFHLAMEVLASLPGTVDVVAAQKAAMKAELTRRVERARSGEEKTYSIEEVMEHLRKQNEARNK